MGKKVKRSRPVESAGGEITINLFGPGMTALHKVGLGGLWMTLEALERESGGQPGLPGIDGSWERTDTSVTLRWDGEAEVFFKALFERSFKIDKNGLIWFPALGDPMNNPHHAVILQEAMLGTFLQHGRTRKSDKAAEPKGSLMVTFDDTPLVIRFHKVTFYAHQKSDYSPQDINPLAGWHFPGGAVRHTGLGQKSTALEEPPERALALRFCPVGAIYFEIRSRTGGIRPRYAIVLPEIHNLDTYSKARECFLRFGVQRLYASGTAEAGLRVLAELRAAHLVG